MTSIIVTVGPSSINIDTLTSLVKAGAHSFRINLSHSNKESLHHYFSILNQAGIIPAIDTQGAQLRVIATNLQHNISVGEKIEIYFGANEKDSLERTNLYILLNHPEAFDQINKGDIMKVDFDGLALEICEKTNQGTCIAKVISSGELYINRAVDIQSKTLSLAVLTEFDKYALDYAISKGSREIYASFISNSHQALEVRNLIGPDVTLISKIETALGVANILGILESSDQILIDRGDLSREISIPSVPLAVFNILKLANRHNTSVLVATNVLDSMMNSNIPSRAEISDIFSHLSAGAAGIVLAAEVAIGSNPVRSTALLKYLIDLFNNYENGLHGIGIIPKPPKELIGLELYNWL